MIQFISVVWWSAANLGAICVLLAARLGYQSIPSEACRYRKEAETRVSLCVVNAQHCLTHPFSDNSLRSLERKTMTTRMVTARMQNLVMMKKRRRTRSNLSGREEQQTNQADARGAGVASTFSFSLGTCTNCPLGTGAFPVLYN